MLLISKKIILISQANKVRHPLAKKRSNNKGVLCVDLGSRVAVFKAFFRVQHEFGKGSGTLSREINIHLICGKY